MVVEIELKVRLDDPEPIKQRLSALGTYCRSYTKNDTYWICATESIPPSGVRVRRDCGVDAAGLAVESALVTYKIRENRDGIEVNDEREFSLAPGLEGAVVFEDLLGRLGLRPGVRKEKRGWAWNMGGQPPALAELSMVTGLGWFLELEILAEDRAEETVTKNRDRLLAFLTQLGVSPERIERRPYTEMLKGLQ